MESNAEVSRYRIKMLLYLRLINCPITLILKGVNILF